MQTAGNREKDRIRSIQYHQYHCWDTAGVTILVDPWLQGDLVFGGQTWLYRGQKGRLDKAHLDIDQIMAEADVVLLSQVRTADVLLTCHLPTYHCRCKQAKQI